MSLRAIAFAALFLAPFALAAQSFSTAPCGDSDSSDGGHWFSSGARVCEVRRATLPLVDGRIAVDGLNGSIEVAGESRQDISLEAKVTAQGGSRQDAEATLHQITIDTQGTIRAHGPRTFNGHGWSVSYRLRVPRQIAARLKTENGNVSLSDLQGSIEATTTNGSLNFRALAGDVHVQTTNGSVNGSLDGAKWDGRGLSATTTNGGISVALSPNYSAHLLASTTNGGISFSHSNLGGVHGRSLDTQLGNGGATLVFQTTNGGVSIR